jgi:hypothetical protein
MTVSDQRVSCGYKLVANNNGEFEREEQLSLENRANSPAGKLAL